MRENSSNNCRLRIEKIVEMSSHCVRKEVADNISILGRGGGYIIAMYESAYNEGLR